jgi:hypothetical protein
MHTDDTIPIGMCQCGCGAPAPISKQTDLGKGYIKGQPRRYVTGHNRRQSRVEYIIDPVTGCWIWKRMVSPDGYGRATIPGSRPQRQTTAHRVVYERHKGPIPEGMELDHDTCGNRRCVNPNHMIPRTPADHRVKDKGMGFAAEDVEDMCRMAADGIPASRIGEKYGCHRDTVFKYVRRHCGTFTEIRCQPKNETSQSMVELTE